VSNTVGFGITAVETACGLPPKAAIASILSALSGLTFPRAASLNNAAVRQTIVRSERRTLAYWV